jgi:hypothetical protein
MAVERHDTPQHRDADIAAAVHATLIRVNPCLFELDIRHGDPRAYEMYVPHISLLIRNGCGVDEVADYIEKQMLLTGVAFNSSRETAVSTAQAIVAAVLPSNTSLERNREG